MPTDRSEQRRYNHRGLMFPNRPWHAKIKCKGIEYSLGYYATKEEAVGAEDDFRQRNGLKGAKGNIPNAIQYERIMELRTQGYTNAQIAVKLNRTVASIRSVIGTYNRSDRVKKRQHQIQKTVADEKGATT